MQGGMSHPAETNVSDIRIRRVGSAADTALRNLFEHYLHDMAEWFELDTNEEGAYAYPTEEIWAHDLTVFLAYSGVIPVAFALVDAAGSRVPGSNARDLKEFFVVRRHRRSGVGRTFAAYVWNQFPGEWLVRVYQGNRPAMPFWRRVIGDYTGGRFRESTVDANGRAWSYFTFSSDNGGRTSSPTGAAGG